MELNEITYEINGAAFEVNKELGAGFLEKVYENAMCVELLSRGLNVLRQAPIQVYYKATHVGDYCADILVENSVIVELKTAETISRMHEAQLLNSLRATGMRIGLLINFYHPKVQIKRLVHRFEEPVA